MNDVDGAAGPAPGELAIVTWFVEDEAAVGTHFPQIGMRSDAPVAKAIYWRCVLTFFATSLKHNRGRPHLFFTNVPVPHVDGIDLPALLARWGVEVICCPVEHRLPAGRVSQWGNQFYVLDIMEKLANGPWPAAVILDADVVWTQPADALLAVIERDGVATYDHDESGDAAGGVINGRSREQLTAFARAWGSDGRRVRYCGGEIVAATRPALRRLVGAARPLWDATIAGAPDAPLEEAHLLSVLYAIGGDPIGNADRQIKRLWTTFHYHNVSRADLALPLWHLPAEKRSGFPALFRRLVRDGIETRPPAAVVPDTATLARLFGIPRRPARKLVRDLAAKLRERLVGV